MWGYPVLLFVFPGLSLLVSALFPLAMQHFYSCVSQFYDWSCAPFSASRVAFLFICFSDLSFALSALFRWRCNISIRLFFRPVTGGVRPLLLAMQHSIHLSPRPVSGVVRRNISIRLSPKSVIDNVRPFPLFLFICFPGLLLLVSALFRWPCSVSIHLFPRPVTGGVRPFLLAMQHF